MKLILNGASLVPPLSGIGRYTQNLLKCLLDPEQYDKSLIEDVQAFSLLGSYGQDELRQLLTALDNEPSQDKRSKALNRLQKIRGLAKHVPGAGALKRAVQQHLLGRKLASCKDAIYWEPNYILEAFDGVSIPTIYDLSHIRYPMYHPADRRRWLDDNLTKTFERATEIITISEFSKREIMETFSVKPSDVTVIPPAVSDEFRQSYTERELEQIRQDYQLPERFILSVGTIEPRKNLAGLLAAFSRLADSFKSSYPLVIVGCSGWLSEDIERMMTPMLDRGQVIRLGYVPQRDLPALFSAARLFVYVSFYEGYGMPIAEAMCSGVPVITSNLSSMPEVAAGCASLVNPNDIEQITQQIQELIENEGKRKQLIERAKKQSDQYVWQDSTQQLVNVFQKHSR